jgi:hypothetical protein
MKTKPEQISQGGFSDPILQPIYVITIGAILFLGPLIGLFWATLFVGVPSFLVALKISELQMLKYHLLTSSILVKARVFIDPNELAYFLCDRNEVSTQVIKSYFGLSRYKSKIVRDEIISGGFADQKITKNLESDKVKVNILKPVIES